MPKNDIGGFFVSLGLNVDKNSFVDGTKQVDAVSTSLNKLIGTAKNVAVVVAALKGINGVINQSSESLNKLNQADIIGSSAEKLNVWRAAAKIAGADANGLLGSISKLANVMNHLTIDGSGLEAYSKQLAELSMGVDQLIGLDPADAMQKIFEVAQSKLDGTDETKLRMTTIIGDILGDAGQELFVTLARNNQSISSWLTGAAATQYQTNEGMEGAAKFREEISKLGETASSIKKAIGDNLATVLYDPVKSINKWFTENKQTIQNGIKNISDGTQKLVDGIGKWWDNHGDEVLDKFNMIISLMSSIFGWMTSEKGRGLFKGIKEQMSISLNASKEIITALFSGYGYEIPNIIQDGLSGMWDSIVETAGTVTGSMKDGILRPDGTITQVAPDDWVFAARNVGDLARAFVPQGMTQTAGSVEFSIVQNFTISGSKDLPQVLKQQAYNGTQEGLMAAMAQSSKRLQLMTGTL